MVEFNQKHIPVEVIPLLDVLSIHGNCTKQENAHINMTPTEPSRNDYYQNYGNLDIALEEFKQQRRAAELVCSLCCVQEICYQYGTTAKVAGVFAGSADEEKRYKKFGPAYEGKDLENYVERVKEAYNV